MFIQFLFIFLFGIVIGGLAISITKNEEINRLTTALASGKEFVDRTKEIMTEFLKRNKEAGILEHFSNADLLNALAKKNMPGIASVRTERLVPHIEILVAITDDYTAHITMTEKAYEVLQKGEDNG